MTDESRPSVTHPAPALMSQVERQDELTRPSVLFDVIRSITDDPDVLEAVAVVERRDPPDTSWVQTSPVRRRYRGRHRRTT